MQYTSQGKILVDVVKRNSRSRFVQVVIRTIEKDYLNTCMLLILMVLNPLRGITPQRQTILLVKGRALVLGWLIRLSAHVSSYPLSRIVPQCALRYYFAMHIKPDNFARQG